MLLYAERVPLNWEDWVYWRSCPGSSWTGPLRAREPTPTLRAVHDPRKISVDLAVAVASAGTATAQITEIRRQSLTWMAAIFERTWTLLREGNTPMTSAPGA